MLRLFERRHRIRFYKPNASAVSLVVEDDQRAWPMKLDRSGYWTVRLHRNLKELHGRNYHFAVHFKDKTETVPDPWAHQVERLDHGMVSRFADITYRWTHRRFVAPPMRDVVIYETHLPALSRHPSAKVEQESHRGTYLGARSEQVLAHLQQLGVAVEFLPLHANDHLLGQDWGYFSTSFHAMRECYACDVLDANREVMSVIDAMHSRGIPVLLDVVFNHGGELWAKAWGDEVVYRKNGNGGYCEGSGCGPTIRTEHPQIRESIIQTLLHLVETYRIDGFRFDLGALHDKDTMREIDRRLPKRVYLIAEPWALGGQKWFKGDLSSDFADTRWAVWNDDFREPGKTFITGRGNHHNRDRLMVAIKGSHVGDGGWALRPQQCINYLTSHDGKTLADFVGSDKRRVFLGMILVLTSQGVPMIGEGSEMMFTKHGESNSYNRPDLNQLNWENAETHTDLVEAVAGLVKLRKKLPHFRYTRRLKQNDGKSHDWDIDWIYPTGFPHHDNVNALGFILKPPSFQLSLRRRKIIVLLNGSHIGADFILPKGKWHVLVDGSRFAVDVNGLTDVPAAKGSYHLHPGTGVILAHP